MGKNYIISNMACVVCGHQGIPIPRPKSSLRESGHLKELYCVCCKKYTNHVELREGSSYNYDDFLYEIDCENFNEQGRRKNKIIKKVI